MDRTQIIRQLNDDFRTKLSGGRLMLTEGIAGRPDTFNILARVSHFTEFTTDNDPYGEHDFGAFEHQGDTLFWKIDCCDKDLQGASPDPCDPKVTTRVLTVMLASEY